MLQNEIIYIPVMNKIKKINSSKTRYDLRGYAEHGAYRRAANPQNVRNFTSFNSPPPCTNPNVISLEKIFSKCIWYVHEYVEDADVSNQKLSNVCGMGQFITFINLRWPCLNAAQHKLPQITVPRHATFWRGEIDLSYNIWLVHSCKVDTQSIELHSIRGTVNFPIVVISWVTLFDLVIILIVSGFSTMLSSILEIRYCAFQQYMAWPFSNNTK